MTYYEVIDILLVEDSETDAELTLRTLRKGRIMNSVIRVRDGAEALRFIESEGNAAGVNRVPRLILLDLNMPKLGGLDVIRSLKSMSGTRDIPIIVLTESAESRDIVDGYNLGINAYLIKPITVASFNEVVTQVGLYWSVTNKAES